MKSGRDIDQEWRRYGKGGRERRSREEPVEAHVVHSGSYGKEYKKILLFCNIIPTFIISVITVHCHCYYTVTVTDNYKLHSTITGV